mmetsp:Transcript_28071/g.39595  ORF Transcript_28071/g.39595 Transcript_28071/m.39595 type:complete len:362 (-) Transcript_28071:1743-2828(-)
MSSIQSNQISNCAQCASPIMFMANMDNVAYVKCYSCSCMNTFEFDYSRLNLDTSITKSSHARIQDTNSNSPQPIGSERKDAKTKVIGTLRSMKEKAQVAAATTSGVMKEKAHVAASITKEKAVSAANKTKAVAIHTKNAVHTKNDQTSDSSDVNAGVQPPAPSPAPAASPPANPNVVIFGVSLNEAVKRSATINPNVPDIVTKCIDYLTRRAVAEEGIFRLSGSQNAVKQLKESFDRGDEVNLDDVMDEHVVSGLLKLYFRSLPESLFTRALLDKFKTVKNAEADVITAEVKPILNDMPTPNKSILKMLVTLLVEITQNQATTKMTVSNISLIFSATLACPMELVTHLIQNNNDMFSDIEV